MRDYPGRTDPAKLPVYPWRSADCHPGREWSGMTYRRFREDGVSGVVGEMLMIALVIVVISVFSASIGNFLPSGRDPSISVMMSNDRQNITLWHKGGDWVRAEDLTVIVGNETGRSTFSGEMLVIVPAKPVFDLGSNITVRLPATPEGNETVRLVTPRTVVYTGKVCL